MSQLFSSSAYKSSLVLDHNTAWADKMKAIPVIIGHVAILWYLVVTNVATCCIGRMQEKHGTIVGNHHGSARFMKIQSRAATVHGLGIKKEADEAVPKPGIEIDLDDAEEIHQAGKAAGASELFLEANKKRKIAQNLFEISELAEDSLSDSDELKDDDPQSIAFGRRVIIQEITHNRAVAHRLQAQANVLEAKASLKFEPNLKAQANDSNPARAKDSDPAQAEDSDPVYATFLNDTMKACDISKKGPLKMVPHQDQLRHSTTKNTVGDISGRALTISEAGKPVMAFFWEEVHPPFFSIANGVGCFAFLFHGNQQIFCAPSEEARNSWINACSEAWFCTNLGVKGELPAITRKAPKAKKNNQTNKKEAKSGDTTKRAGESKQESPTSGSKKGVVNVAISVDEDRTGHIKLNGKEIPGGQSVKIDTSKEQSRNLKEHKTTHANNNV